MENYLETIDKKTIKYNVKKILVDKLGLDVKDIKNKSLLVNDLGIDSFAGVQLLFAIKEEFGIEILLDDLNKIERVSDIVEYIFNKLNIEKNNE